MVFSCNPKILSQNNINIFINIRGIDICLLVSMIIIFSYFFYFILNDIIININYINLLKMSVLYKLGDGPLNFDWNPRFVSIESTEIIYSPSQYDKEKKTINIYGGAVSNVCKIKGKSFAFCVILPPPINKSLFFASDTCEDATEIRNKMIKATLNNTEMKNKENKNDKVALGKFTEEKITGEKNLKKNKNMNSKSNEINFLNYNLRMSEEFLSKLELLRKDIIQDEEKFFTKFDGDLKISVPKEFYHQPESGYLSIIKLIFVKILIVIIFFQLFNLIFNNFAIIFIDPDHGKVSYVFFHILKILFFYKFFGKILNWVMTLSFIQKILYKRSDSQKYNSNYIAKSCTIVDRDPNEIIKILSDYKQRSEWDFYISNRKDINIDNSCNTKFAIKFTLPYIDYFTEFIKFLLQSSHNFNKQVSKDNGINLENFNYEDECGNNYIFFRQNFSSPNNMNNKIIRLNDTRMFELFVLIPMKSKKSSENNSVKNKTLITFLTNFNPNNLHDEFTSIPPLPFYLVQRYKENRLNILSTLKHHIECCHEIDLPEIHNEASEHDIPTKDTNANSLYNNPQAKKTSINTISNKFNSSKSANILNEDYFNMIDNDMQGYQTFRTQIDPTNKIDIYDNDTIITKGVLTKGRRVSLEERYPGYMRNPEGGVECRNTEELKSQEGIIVELMKRVGKQLLEGKNLVGVSLPVRIFEPRSTLERISDLWGAGPYYLNKAAKVANPIERMKLAIAFAISGMHTNIKQLKPFNPILGETYEAYWPDKSLIYVEHISHHPPISRFLILSGNNLWKFYGHYEYAANFKGINSIGGQFRGPNIIEFTSSEINKEIITFTFPFMNISGLMYGKRTVEWEGSMEFSDIKNSITAKLNFTVAPKFYQKFKEPTDVFRGEIMQNDKIIHKIYGSPLDKLVIDSDVFWELETVDIITPIETKYCIPSDCRYRTDTIYLAENEIKKAEEEKLRLEVIQRADRSLRQKQIK